MRSLRGWTAALVAAVMLATSSCGGTPSSSPPSQDGAKATAPPKVPDEIAGEAWEPTDQGGAIGPNGKLKPPDPCCIGARYGEGNDENTGLPTYLLIVFRAGSLDSPLRTPPGTGSTREIDGVAITCAPVASTEAPSVIAQCIWADDHFSGVLRFFADTSEDEMFERTAEARSSLLDANGA